MSLEGLNFDTALFVQLCGGEPALYDPSCQGNVEAACWRISRTLEKRRDDRVPPRKVKPVFDRMRAIYEKEVMERARGGYKELNWYSPMDAYMRRFLSWVQGPSSSSENVSDPEETNNAFNGNKPETVRQEVSHSEPGSNLEKTRKENGNNHALEKEARVTNEIPDGKDIMTSIAEATSRKSFNTPTKGFNSIEEAELEGTAKSGCMQNELTSEDDPCDVCRKVLPEEENEMLYCDSCDVCVHQDCYGVDKIPEGPWFCSPCSVKIQPMCALCPKRGGAMKKISNDRQWAHLSCALWVKEAELLNTVKMEPIDISNIPEDRWKLVCSLCQVKYGACIQCVAPRCIVAYHATCAIYSKEQTIEICVSEKSKYGVKMVTYCKKHSQVGPVNSQMKRKHRRSSKKPSTHKRSSLDGNYTNEAFPKFVDRMRLSESESTSDSSLCSGMEFSSSSEANKQPLSKRIKRSESGGKKPLPSTRTPCKNQSNAEREPDETPQKKPLFYPPTCSDAHQKTNIEDQHCELNEQFEFMNNKHCNTEQSTDYSTPQGKQKTLLDMPGYILIKKDTTTPRNSVSCIKKHLVFEHQNENRSVASEEPLSVRHNHLPSTSTAISLPMDQSSSSSLDNEQTYDEAHATTWSKAARIEQLTKTVAIEMRNLPDREARKLERKIVCLCIKSHKKSRNLKN